MPPRGRAGFAGAAVSSSAGGIRTHGLELMRLARKREALVRRADQWRGSGGTGRSPQRQATTTAQVWPAGVEPAVSGAQSRRGGHAPLRPEVKWEEGLASLNRGGALLRTLPDAIRYPSARLPATVMDRRHSLGPSVDDPIQQSTPGGTRTRSFRIESPASSPVRPRGRAAPAAGLEPAPRD